MCSQADVGGRSYCRTQEKINIITEMVLLTVTPQILNLTFSVQPSALPNGLQLPTSLSSPIDHKTLILLSRLTKTSLDTLLHNTRPYFAPPPPPPTPSSEYLALKARLLAEQEQRAYDRIVPTSTTKSPLFLASGDPSDDISPSLVLNILLSIVLCAFVAFHVTRFWTNDGLRVLTALGVGIVVGVAEVVVYSAYLSKKVEARDKEDRKKERKVVIGEARFDSDVHGVVGLRDIGKIENKEEIWGRGLNGGMRRRVREKWEKEQKLTS
jgi:TMEM199 family protein